MPGCPEFQFLMSLLNFTKTRENYEVFKFLIV